MQPLQSRAQELLHILDTLSPSDIINADVSARFTAFLQRGSPEECWKLVPQTHKAAICGQRGWNIASSDYSAPKPPKKRRRGSHEPRGTCASQERSISTISNSTATSEPSKQCYSPAYTRLPTPASTNGQQPIEPETFFEQNGCNKTRSGELARACKAIIEAKALPEGFYEKLWVDKDGPFKGAELHSDRISRLQRGRLKAALRIAEYSHIYILSLLYLRLEVDHHSNTLGKVKLRHGYTKLSTAIETLAKASGTDLDTFRADFMNGNIYFHWLAANGPGSLFHLGRLLASYWETRFTKNDLHLIAKYIEKYHSNVYDSFRSDDVDAARCIILGLREYGWTFFEIHSSKTPLITEIKKYVRIPERSGPIVAINHDQQQDKEQTIVNEGDQTTTCESYKAQRSVLLFENSNNSSSVLRNSPSQVDSNKCVQALISTQFESNIESLHPERQTPVAMRDRVVGIGQAETVVSSDDLQLLVPTPITSSSIDDIMPNLNVENRSGVFAGHDTPTGQEELIQKDLLSQMQTPNSPDATYVGGEDLLEADHLFQSFFGEDFVETDDTNSLYT